MQSSPLPNFTEESKLKMLHQVYSEVTKQPVSLTLRRMDHWRVFIKHGWTDDDLRLVVAYIRREHPKFPAMLRFSRLIEMPEQFEEYLALAMAVRRNARPARTQRDAVIAAAGLSPEEINDQNVVTPKDVLDKGYDRLRKIIDEM